jgi:hypothetical protein
MKTRKMMSFLVPSQTSTQFWTISNLLMGLVFKFSSIDPRVKCSEIVWSVNVMKVTSGVITFVIIDLHDLLPMVGLEVGMATVMPPAAIECCTVTTYQRTHFDMLLPREMILEKQRSQF